MLCVGQAEVDSGWGRAPVDLGEFVVGPGEADLESFDFAEPAFPFGFADAVGEIVSDLDQPVPLGGVRAQHRTADVPLTETVGRSWWRANVNAT